MKNRNKIFLIIVTLSLILPLGLSPEPVRIFENLYAETSPLPPSLPDRVGLKMVAFFVTEDEGGLSLSVALYDDAQTKREVDYMELYNDEGDLLLVSWIDHHGIKRLAVERGLLEEEDGELDRGLVFFTVGTPL